MCWPARQPQIYKQNWKPSRNGSKLSKEIELKNSLAHKMKLWVWGYTNGEYLSMLVDGRLTLKYKTYTIKSQDDALEAWKIQQKELILNAEFGIWAEEKNKKEDFYLFWVASQTSACICGWCRRWRNIKSAWK